MPDGIIQPFWYEMWKIKMTEKKQWKNRIQTLINISQVKRTFANGNDGLNGHIYCSRIEIWNQCRERNWNETKLIHFNQFITYDFFYGKMVGQWTWSTCEMDSNAQCEKWSKIYSDFDGVANFWYFLSAKNSRYFV